MKTYKKRTSYYSSSFLTNINSSGEVSYQKNIINISSIFKIIILFLLFDIILCNIEVANGRKSRKDEYPHLVSIFKYPANPKHFCAGGLINNFTVLLAAHCFDSVSDPTTLYVQAGTHLVNSKSLGVISHVKRAKLHPLWDKEKYDKDGNLVNDYDIALIYLETAINENGTNIRYMDVDSNPLPIGTSVDVAGWGYYSSSYYRDFYSRTITIPTRISSDCSGCNDTIMICAGNLLGKDSCNGDSGTPLVRVEKLTQKRWIVAGTLSFGDSGCGKIGSAGVYTKVSVFADWVWQNAVKPPPPSPDMENLLYIEERFENITCDSKPGFCKNGTCKEISNHSLECECFKGYSGINCQLFSCFGKFNEDEFSCNAGVCISPDKCECEKGFSENDCSICNNSMCNNNGKCIFYPNNQTYICECDDLYEDQLLCKGDKIISSDFISLFVPTFLIIIFFSLFMLCQLIVLVLFCIDKYLKNEDAYKKIDDLNEKEDYDVEQEFKFNSIKSGGSLTDSLDI